MGFGMNNIVIVEDNLAKGISLAEQFQELASKKKASKKSSSE